MTPFHKAIIFLAFLLPTYSLTALAEDAPKPANPSAAWVARIPPEVRVNVDRKRQTVSVTINNKDSRQLPKSIGITLYDAAGNSTSLELKAIEPPREADAGGSPAQSHFGGTVGPAAESYVGFELRIPFGSEPPAIVRSEDLRDE